MDHAHHAFRTLTEAPRFAWPDDARIAFTVTLVLDYWELNPPPGANPDPRIVSPLGKFFPDWLTWSQREYGARVGIFRVLDVLDRFGVTPSVALGAAAAKRYPDAGCGKPLAAIAISPAKVVRLRPCLAGIDYLFLNQAEASALTGGVADDPRQWVSSLRALGLKGGVITRGHREIVAFSGDTTATIEPPRVEQLGDVTGAGDSLAAGVLSALLAGLDLPEALRHGVAAAAITVQSPFAVAENLSADLMISTLGLVGEAKMLS